MKNIVKRPLRILMLAHFATFALLALSLSGLSTAGDQRARATSMPDIVGVARATGEFNTFLVAMDAAGLTQMLRDGGPYTLFAPTDAAFARLPDDKVAELLYPENRDRLVALLSHHVVPDAVETGDVAWNTDVTTLNGTSVSLVRTGDVIRSNDAAVVSADIEARNGIIHIIDQVMLPAEIE